jgi:hypothetical protein
MKYLKSFEAVLFSEFVPEPPPKMQKVQKMPHFGNDYYINNDQTLMKIMSKSPGDNIDGIYSEEQVREKKFRYAIDYIRRNPYKFITFGNKTNATSIKISKKEYEILKNSFPEKSNIKE